MTETALVQSPLGVMTVLCAVVAFYFWLEQFTRWKLFQFLPPLLWIYATPVILNNTGVIPGSSPVYGGLRTFALPVFIVLMLLYVNVPAAVRIMGKGILVMLLGTAGIVVGGVVAYAIVHRWLAPDAWAGYGALAGSWIGGTGNMAAASEALGTSGEMFGLAVVADNVIYLVWLPLLLSSKSFAERFNKWARVPPERIAMMEQAAAAEHKEEVAPEFQHYLYLIFIAMAVTWFCGYLADTIYAGLAKSSPGLSEVFSRSTINILLLTTVALGLSVTRLREIPGGQKVATAIIYLFVARMGAVATIDNLGDAPIFLLGAFIWITIHGLFCLAGAYIFRVDVHSTAIASAANVGGAASAPVVAAYHRESLVPVAILMALIGYAMGNYLAILTGRICQLIAGG